MEKYNFKTIELHNSLFGNKQYIITSKNEKLKYSIKYNDDKEIIYSQNIDNKIDVNSIEYALIRDFKNYVNNNYMLTILKL